MYTGQKDKNGKCINSDHKVGGWFSAPWDEQQPIWIEFTIEKMGDRWWCHSASDADNYLSEMKNLKIVKRILRTLKCFEFKPDFS